MKKYIAILCLITLFSAPAHADKNEKIHELIKIMNLENMEEALNEQMIYPITCSFELTSAEEEDLKARLLKTVNLQDKIVEMATPIWEELFTEEDLDQILEFYKSPVGAKTIALMPKMSQEIAAKTIEYQQELQPKLLELLSDIASTHGQRSGMSAQLCLQNKIKSHK